MIIESSIVAQAYTALESDDAMTFDNLLKDRPTTFIDALLNSKYAPGKTLSSLIENRPECNKIIQNLKTFDINNIPVEVLHNILYPQLSNQAMASLMSSCKTQKTFIEKSKTFRSRLRLAPALKSALTYFKKNVSELDLSPDLRKELLGFSVPPENASVVSKLLFIHKAQNILNRIISQVKKVKSEITYLKQNAAALNISEDLRTRLLNHPILQDTTKTLNLTQLKATNSLVNEINSAIILSKIDQNSTTLFLNNAYLTRLPMALLNEPNLQDYWKRLKGLVCSDNQLSNLDVTSLSELVFLDLSNNQLTNLDATGLSKLVSLRLNNNQLTSLKLTGLIALGSLWCTSNQLTSLDATGLSALKYIWCAYNQLTNLNLPDLSALKSVWCPYNKLTITAELRALFNHAWAYEAEATQQAPEPVLPTKPVPPDEPVLPAFKQHHISHAIRQSEQKELHAESRRFTIEDLSGKKQRRDNR